MDVERKEEREREREREEGGGRERGTAQLMLEVRSLVQDGLSHPTIPITTSPALVQHFCR